MKLGDKITFNRYVKHNHASVDLDEVELPYELVRIDEIALPEPLTGIVCGKRKIVKSTQFDFGDFYSDGYKQHNTEIQVYLVATRMDGFYRVPVEWVSNEKCERSDPPCPTIKAGTPKKKRSQRAFQSGSSNTA